MAELKKCHEEVADADGELGPCDRTATGWRIDPGEGQPYPVCSWHHRPPYADGWVAAEAKVARVREFADWLADRDEILDQDFWAVHVVGILRAAIGDSRG